MRQHSAQDWITSTLYKLVCTKTPGDITQVGIRCNMALTEAGQTLYNRTDIKSDSLGLERFFNSWGPFFKEISNDLCQEKTGELYMFSV